MRIANPIYDVVFRYLMEDETVAKLMIGTIIGEEIVELDFLPQENTVFLQPYSLTVHRLDFSAKIELPDGHQKQVLIEIQKAKFATDIMRFRRYLARQYQDSNNSYLVTTNGHQQERRARPIITIYFLGYPLEELTAPVIHVARQYRDVTTGEELETREQFIESLTHDSYIIQIPHLRHERQSEVEQLLTVFDQRWLTADGHVLSLNEADYPEQYRQVIRRLQQAISDEVVRQTMEAEDEILENFELLEREIAMRDEALVKQQQAIAQRDEALAEQQEVIAQRDEALAEQQQALTDMQQTIADLQRRLQNLE